MKNDLKFDKVDARKRRNNVSLDARNDVFWRERNDISWKARNLVAWKKRKLKLAFWTVFMLVFITSNFDQVGGLFKMGHHVHHVFQSLKPRIDEFKSYLLSRKQFGLYSKLGFGFVHVSMEIRVL